MLSIRIYITINYLVLINVPLHALAKVPARQRKRSPHLLIVLASAHLDTMALQLISARQSNRLHDFDLRPLSSEMCGPRCRPPSPGRDGGYDPGFQLS